MGELLKLKNASDESWEKFKSDIDKASAELKDAAEGMTKQFKT